MSTKATASKTTSTTSKAESFEVMLTGGHPNSLGRTLEVVDIVLDDEARLEELIWCYESSDEIVRLRTSNALKRTAQVHPEWLVPYLEHLLIEISTINQASTQWTLALLFDILVMYMSDAQKQQAIKVMKTNLTTSNDWIVLNNTMKVLSQWCQADPELITLKAWLIPQLERLRHDTRKSVAKNAHKHLATLTRLP